MFFSYRNPVVFFHTASAKMNCFQGVNTIFLTGKHKPPTITCPKERPQMPMLCSFLSLPSTSFPVPGSYVTMLDDLHEQYTFVLYSVAVPYLSFTSFVNPRGHHPPRSLVPVSSDQFSVPSFPLTSVLRQRQNRNGSLRHPKEAWSLPLLS